MNGLVVRTLNARRQFGIMGAAQAATFKLLNIKSFFVCEREFSTGNVEEAGIVRASSLEPVWQLHRQGAPLRYLPDRLGPNDVLVIHHGVDGPDGLFWLSPTPFEAPAYDWLRIDLAEGDIHGRFLWVAPGARGRGLGPLLNRAADRFCLEAGYRRVVSGVSTFNTPALRADRKIGYRPIVRVLMMRLFKLCYVDVAGVRRAGLFDSKAPLRLSFGQLRALAKERDERGGGIRSDAGENHAARSRF